MFDKQIETFVHQVMYKGACQQLELNGVFFPTVFLRVKTNNFIIESRAKCIEAPFYFEEGSIVPSLNVYGFIVGENAFMEIAPDLRSDKHHEFYAKFIQYLCDRWKADTVIFGSEMSCTDLDGEGIYPAILISVQTANETWDSVNRIFKITGAPPFSQPTLANFELNNTNKILEVKLNA